MKATFCCCLFFALTSGLCADAQPSVESTLIALDLRWESALLESDVDFLQTLLAEDFIWVHNHASLMDTKEDVLNRAREIQKGRTDTTKARKSRDQRVILLGTTAVVSGFTTVDRGPTPITYHFMRTYVREQGTYVLLANQTMAIPD